VLKTGIRRTEEDISAAVRAMSPQEAGYGVEATDLDLARTRHFPLDVPLCSDFNGTILHPLCRFRTSSAYQGSSAGGSASQFPADSGQLGLSNKCRGRFIRSRAPYVVKESAVRLFSVIKSFKR
jgi:hypothetical protein